MEILEEMIAFWYRRERGPRISEACKTLDDLELYWFCGLLLNWMADVSQGIKHGPLELEIEKPFPRKIRDVLTSSQVFQRLFLVSNQGGVSLSPRLSVSDLASITSCLQRKFAQQLHSSIDLKAEGRD